MNNIKEQVDAAIEEFGDDAYRRFCDSKNLSFTHNDELLRKIVGWCDIQLKPLPEFEHDIKFYGDNAYFMWQRYGYVDDELKWFDCLDNECVSLAIENDNNVRRKKSAALPFDLERAKAGDVVENLNHKNNKWVTLTFFKPEFLDISDYKDFRMKYPKKVKND